MKHKKTYATLELNVYRLDVADIVRTSPNNGNNDLEWDWN